MNSNFLPKIHKGDILMSKASAYAVKFDGDRFGDLVEELNETGFFAEAVYDFEFSKRQALVAIIVSPEMCVTHVGRAKKGVRAATGMRRLNLIDLTELSSPLPVSDILQEVPNRVKRRARNVLEAGGLLTPKAFVSVVDAMIALRPQAAEFLKRFSTTTRQRLRELSPEAKSALAFQKETVASALTFSGIGREPLGHWELDETDTPISYLEGLEEARMMEDSMVGWDLHRVPGFDEVQSLPHVSTALFRDENTVLHVTLANKQPLERQTGADLIYFNQTFGAFVMVQYKAMELDENRAAFFRFPQKQLSEEIKRMDEILHKLTVLQPDAAARSYRMIQNPFFLKFCPRIQFEPDSTALTSGMYLPLDLWKCLETDPRVNGPRGGKSLTYRNVERFVDNSSFVTLVANAWVGTTVSASKILAEWIKHIVESGRAVTFAVKKENGDDDDMDRGYVYDPSPTLEVEQDESQMVRVRN